MNGDGEETPGHLLWAGFVAGAVAEALKTLLLFANDRGRVRVGHVDDAAPRAVVMCNCGAELGGMCCAACGGYATLSASPLLVPMAPDEVRQQRLVVGGGCADDSSGLGADGAVNGSQVGGGVHAHVRDSGFRDDVLCASVCDENGEMRFVVLRDSSDDDDGDADGCNRRRTGSRRDAASHCAREPTPPPTDVPLTPWYQRVFGLYL